MKELANEALESIQGGGAASDAGLGGLSGFGSGMGLGVSIGSLAGPGGALVGGLVGGLLGTIGGVYYALK